MPTFTTADGVRVAAYDLGGTGPALLLAHATGFHGRVLAPLADRLAHQFHCYAFDERGHGDSDPAPGGDYDWGGFALDALAVVDGFALERPAAFGHSCGGALLLLAEQARPGTFSGLYLFEPIVRPDDGPGQPTPGNPLAEGALRRREVFPSRDEARANYAGKRPLSVLEPAALDAYVEHGFAEEPDGTVRLKCRGEAESAVYTMGFAHDAYSGLGGMDLAVRLACGSDTDAIGPAVLERLADRLPQSSIEVFAGLGHFGPLQDSARVARSVSAVLLS